MCVYVCDHCNCISILLLVSLEGNSTKKEGGGGADGKGHSQYFRFIFTTQCVDKTTVQGRRRAREGRSWQACRLTCSLQFPFPLSTASPRPLSVVIHFCIHFAHLMPCLLSCSAPSTSRPLSLLLSLSFSISLSPSQSLTNCAACVSLLAKKLKALRPVYVCLCPSALLLSLSLPVGALWSHLIGASIFLGSLPVWYVSYCSSLSSTSHNLSPTASQLRAIRTSG